MPTAAASPADRLDTLPADIPDLTLGYEAARWAEHWLVQPNGPRAGQPFRLTDRQLRFLVHFYALDDEGRWLYHHGVRRLAKGSGKSPFAAVLALVELCAPVRLLDWAPKRPGGCIGKPVDMPLVEIAATAESQTSNTMRMIRAFAPKRSKVVEAHHLDPGKVVYYRSPEGELRVITSSYTAAEGSEPSFVVGDESEHWRPSNGGVALAATLEDNLAKSGGRLLETANAYVPGEDSVAETTTVAWLLQEEGRTRGEGRILYDAVIAPPTTDLADEGSLRAALEFVYADCDWIDVETIVRRVLSPKARPDDSKRKYLNWPTASADSWVAPEDWARLADPTVTVADGDEVVMFFDGSKSRDATALVGCRLEDGHVFTLGVWEPDRGDHDATVDAGDVDRVVMRAFDTYRVVAFFADVREWESYALAEWPNRYAADLEVWSVPRGRPPQAVAWDMRAHAYEFAKAAEACHAEIVDRAFTHDGSSAVARHVANARRRPYRDLVSVGKESHDSPKKIDAAVCVIGARMVRRLVMGDPKRKRRRTGRAAFA